MDGTAKKKNEPGTSESSDPFPPPGAVMNAHDRPATSTSEADIRHVGIVGLGYVGRPLLELFAAKGVPVTGFDADPERLKRVNIPPALEESAEQAAAPDAPDEPRRAAAATTQPEVTADMSRLGEPDALLICVPTPLDAHREPDLQHVERAADAIAASLRPGQLIVLESTTYPGTTRSVVEPRLRKAGVCFGLAYSPERIDPGRRMDLSRIPKLVGGWDEASGDAAEALYRRVFERVVRVSSCEVAEAAKLLENVYRAVNIALVNEMKPMLLKMGIDVWEVIDAASTKPFGFEPFYPGPGMGGHCIPVDPFYLAWAGRQVGWPSTFVERAGEVNRAMPGYVVQRTMEAITGEPAASPPPPDPLAHDPTPRIAALNDRRVLVLGVAYKPDMADTRESPSLAMLKLFDAAGAHADYHDFFVPRFAGRESVELTPEALDADAVVVATAHTAYDWSEIARHARLVVDTRGVMRKASRGRAKVVLA